MTSLVPLTPLSLPVKLITHYNDVIMGAMASQITSRTIVNSTVYIQAQIQESIKSPRPLAFARGIHR